MERGKPVSGALSWSLVLALNQPKSLPDDDPIDQLRLD